MSTNNINITREIREKSLYLIHKFMEDMKAIRGKDPIISVCVIDDELVSINQNKSTAYIPLIVAAHFLNEREENNFKFLQGFIGKCATILPDKLPEFFSLMLKTTNEKEKIYDAMRMGEYITDTPMQARYREILEAEVKMKYNTNAKKTDND